MVTDVAMLGRLSKYGNWCCHIRKAVQNTAVDVAIYVKLPNMVTPAGGDGRRFEKVQIMPADHYSITLPNKATCNSASLLGKFNGALEESSRQV